MMFGSGASVVSGARHSARTGSALVKCGKTRTIGLMAPITGPAASLGQPQVHWAQYFVSTYNKAHKTKVKVQGQEYLILSARDVLAVISNGRESS